MPLQIETMIEAVTRERPLYLTESRPGLRISPLSPPIDSTVKLAPCGNDDNIQQNTGIALLFVQVLYLTLHVCSEVHFSAMMQKVYSRNARKDAVYRGVVRHAKRQRYASHSSPRVPVASDFNSSYLKHVHLTVQTCGDAYY